MQNNIQQIPMQDFINNDLMAFEQDLLIFNDISTRCNQIRNLMNTKHMILSINNVYKAYRILKYRSRNKALQLYCFNCQQRIDAVNTKYDGQVLLLINLTNLVQQANNRIQAIEVKVQELQLLPNKLQLLNNNVDCIVNHIQRPGPAGIVHIGPNKVYIQNNQNAVQANPQPNLQLNAQQNAVVQ
ncbi:Hypothetical_protein [Hexamita inflata]|uniref:Hypothetical_protein n=1 Tax=Hexamita inflata TaxID=28002 RepID=A0ABP1M107_9EUKA